MLQQTRKTAQLRLIEIERGQRLEAILRDGFAAGKSWAQIARELGCSRVSLINWARSLGGQVQTQRTIRFPSDDERGGAS